MVHFLAVADASGSFGCRELYHVQDEYEQVPEHEEQTLMHEPPNRDAQLNQNHLCDECLGGRYLPEHGERTAEIPRGDCARRDQRVVDEQIRGVEYREMAVLLGRG